MVCNIVELAARVGLQLSDDLVGFLTVLLEGLRGSWTAHCTTGPLAKDPPVDGIVETDYFAILARLILSDLPSFTAAVEAAAPTIDGVKPSLDTTMKWLLEEWFSHFENTGDPSRRKLMALALTKLLETNQPFILLNLQSLMTLWTDVITELREGAEDMNGDSLVYAGNGTSSEEGEEVGPEAPEDAKRRQLTYSDEVHAVNLVEFVRHYLQQAIAASGGSFEQEWLVNVDKDVVGGFTQLGVM